MARPPAPPPERRPATSRLLPLAAPLGLIACVAIVGFAIAETLLVGPLAPAPATTPTVATAPAAPRPDPRLAVRPATRPVVPPDRRTAPATRPASRPAVRPAAATGMSDRILIFETPAAFASGELKSAAIAESATRPAGVQLAGADDFPRTGTWTSPELEADFPFTELLPSWNALCPPGTGVQADIRTRDAATGQWSPWLYIGSWGRVQSERRVTEFADGKVAVDILELTRPALAMQVRVRLESVDLSPTVTPVLRRLVLCYSGPPATATTRPASNTTRPAAAPVPPPRPAAVPRDVVSVDPIDLASSSDGVAAGILPINLPVPFRAQSAVDPTLSSRICSPTSVTMLLAYGGADLPTLDNAMAILDPDTGLFGNWNRAVQYAGSLGFDAYLTRVRSWDHARRYLAAGQPLVASIRFEKGRVRGFLYEKTDGHLIVIRGLTPDGYAIVNDPADKRKGDTVLYPADQLAIAWFDNGGVTYIIRPKIPATRPSDAVLPVPAAPPADRP